MASFDTESDIRTSRRKHMAQLLRLNTYRLGGLKTYLQSDVTSLFSLLQLIGRECGGAMTSRFADRFFIKRTRRNGPHVGRWEDVFKRLHPHWFYNTLSPRSVCEHPAPSWLYVTAGAGRVKCVTWFMSAPRLELRTEIIAIVSRK